MPDYALTLDDETVVVRPNSEWCSWAIDKGIGVNAPGAHFLGFCRKRGPYTR